jgi:sulfur carrier protein
MNDTTSTIVLQLDDGPRELPAGSTLADLLAALNLAPEAVGTAVDGHFVPRGRRAACALRSGQSVQLFRPIVGG